MNTKPTNFVQLGRIEIFVHAGPRRRYHTEWRRSPGDLGRNGWLDDSGGVSAAIRAAGGDEIAAQLQVTSPWSRVPWSLPMLGS